MSTPVPELGPIPTAPYDIGLIPPAPAKDTELLLSIDLEGSGGETNTLNGTCSIGIYGKVRGVSEPVLSYEVSVSPLAGQHDPEQVRTYWLKLDEIELGHSTRIAELTQDIYRHENPDSDSDEDAIDEDEEDSSEADRISEEFEQKTTLLAKLTAELQNARANKLAWQRIVAAERPRLEVAEELIAIVRRIKELGWKPVVVARPVGFDFRELTAFFETLGLERLATEPSFQEGRLSSDQILAQARTGHKIGAGIVRDYRNSNMVSPFGFGGQTQVIDIAQQMIGMAKGIGFQPLHFNQVMKKVIGRDQLSHGGLQDAIDQLQTWEKVLDLSDAVHVARREAVMLGLTNRREEVLQNVIDAEINLAQLIADLSSILRK